MAVNILRRLLRRSRLTKRAERYANPRVVAYYWDGGAPVGRRLKNISVSGAYLYTPERWYLGTIITVTLRQWRGPSSRESATLSVLCRVVRWGSDGVGLRFLLPRREHHLAMEEFVFGAVIAPRLNFADAAKAKSGQALVEYALILPLLFLLIINAINFGAFFFAWITVADAARAGAQYAALGSAGASAPLSANPTQIHDFTLSDMSSLPNTPVTINVCRTNDTGCPISVPVDPEGYALAVVDVTYPYTALVPLFDFPGLGIHATMLPPTIHRRVVMRTVQ